VLADAAFWRQQAFLALRTTLGGAVAIAEVSLLAAGGGLAALPLYYRHTRPDVGRWRIDTLGEALACLPIGLLVLALALAALVPLAAVSRFLAARLLGPAVTPLDPAESRRRRVRALLLHAATVAGIDALLVVIWAAVNPHAGFWPRWALIPLALPLALHGVVELDDARPALRARTGRALALHAGATLAGSLFFVLLWLAAGAGGIWAVWPILGLAVVLAVHALARALGAGRIRRLEETRTGAVELQESELRRIERNLHDGAQARLVAIGMTLGLAEQRFAADPEGARQLVVEAREGMGAALQELRDLARGIHPPILADRGLAAAIAALADRSPLPVAVEADVPERPAPPVETAAYFVVAEALANAAKHAGASSVQVRIARRGQQLEIEVADDGRGGADPEGGGLRGLRHRVEALDGSLAVDSPPGGPTTVRAELPCAS
jgi:signal transduction histidine kinase